MANLRVDKITSTETFETTGSVQFDGSGDRLDFASNTDFAMGTGDFTAECWVYVVKHTHVEGGYGQRVFDSSTGQLGIYINSDGTGGYVGALVSGADIRPTVTHGIAPEGTWTHAAICRSGDDFRIFVNGREAAYRSGTGSVASSADFRVGARASGEGGLKGFVSNLRVIKGKALYTSNFKPSMRELEVTAETVLLACQSKTDATLEKTGKAVEAQGNVVASELTPGLLTPVVKSGGGSAITGSVEFGENDYLTLSPSTDFNFGTGDFTIEFWIHPQKRFTSFPTIFEIHDSVNDNNLYINFRNGANLALTSASAVFAQNGLFNLDDWFHVAVVRTSGQSRLYMNGVGGSSVSCTNNFGGSNNGIVYIGWDHTNGSTEKYNGFISNLRVNKGTALYTDDFTPPTRELKKVPGTVLLCCQDPDNPLTEATGKTITGYGDLQQDSPELVTDGEFESASNWSSAASDWTVGSGQAVINSSNSGYDLLGQLATSLLNGEQYELVFSVTNYSTGRLELTQSSSGNIGVESPNGRNVFRFTYTGTAGGSVDLYSYTANTASFTLTNVSFKRVFASKSGSNFTPQVGNDRKVTFEGVTKINSDAYFYLPTGNTITRESRSGRGLFGGGETPTSPNTTNIIDYIQIQTQGIAQDFGDLTQARRKLTSFSSSTRGIFGDGATPGATDIIDYVTIATTGNALDFGDTTQDCIQSGGCSNQVRGLFGGGYNTAPTVTGLIQYVTIATKGDTISFGNLTQERFDVAGCASPTRGIFGGGKKSPTSENFDIIDYVTIMSTGNAVDFGNLTVGRRNPVSCSSTVRGLFAGGFATPLLKNEIDYITIASTGNAQDFGDLTVAKQEMNAGLSDNVRGVFGGGQVPSAPIRLNSIDYVTIASTGNAQDFGDLTGERNSSGSASDSHGGLG